MTEQELDRRIRDALLLAEEAEYAFLLPGEPAELPVPPELLRRMRPLLADPFGRKRRLRRRAGRTAAAVVLAAALTAGTVLAVSPEARAWVRNMIVEILEEYTTIRFVDETGGQTGETGQWAPAWLPEGYKLKEEMIDPFYSILIYQNSKGNEISLHYTNSEGAAFNLDNEHHTEKTILVNGTSAYLLQATEDGQESSLTWYDELSRTAFLLLAELPPEELIQIAESVEKN